jgi:hypothetical protein
MRKTGIACDGLEADVSVSLKRDTFQRLRVGRIDVDLRPCISHADRVPIRRCIEVFESCCVVTESVRRGIPVTVSVMPQICDVHHEALEPHSWG